MRSYLPLRFLDRLCHAPMNIPWLGNIKNGGDAYFRKDDTKKLDMRQKHTGNFVNLAKNDSVR